MLKNKYVYVTLKDAYIHTCIYTTLFSVQNCSAFRFDTYFDKHKLVDAITSKGDFEFNASC